MTTLPRDFYDASMTAIPPGVTLAQAEASVFFWLIVLIAALLALVIGVAWLRRRLSPNEDFHGEGFTLGDLRRLHQSGKLSSDEYEKAKAALIADTQAAAARKEREKQRGAE